MRLAGPRTMAACVLVALACFGSSAPDDGRGALLLRIAYTTDTGGQLDTCGCAAGQFGGLARRASLLRSLAPAGVPLVAIDGGGVVTDYRQAPYFAEAYAAMGYGLVLATSTDGERLVAELAARGVTALQRLTPASDQALPTVPIDLADGRQLLVIASPEGAVPLPALAGRVRRAVEGADRAGTVVLLATRLDAAGNQRLASGLGDAVDLIVGASTPARTRNYGEPIPEGKAVSAVSQGKALTVTDVYLEPDGRKRIQARFEPVSPGLIEDPAVKAIVERYYAEAAPASRPGAAATGAAEREWADAETCGTCHAKELEAWKGSAHARAVGTLADAGRLVDECLACHSEDFRRRGAFDPARPVPGDGVTCATCHGDGVIHSVNGKVEFVRRTMEARDCTA